MLANPSGQFSNITATVQRGVAATVGGTLNVTLFFAPA